MIRRILCVLGAAALVAPVSLAGNGARNLIATPAVKAALRAAFLRAHPKIRPARVVGPLKGRTYYGSYRGREYALAVFSIPRFGTTDQPELFRRPAGGAWRDLGDTGGDVCPPNVPLPLIRVWQLKPSGGGCYY